MTTKDKQLLKYCGVFWTIWIVLLIACAASAQAIDAQCKALFDPRRERPTW